VRLRRLVPLVVTLSLAAPARAEDPPGTPHATFENAEVDAGEVTRGKDVAVTFVVRNTGDAVLRIISAKPG